MATAKTDRDTDIGHMRTALGLARRGLGRVAPNPAVGCVIVRDGVVVGRGWTQPGGRPHGEAQALERAGEAARGATAYVSLEPCAHWGKTPPCADALVEAGVVRVVVAAEDPDPRVSGRGIERLRGAGIEVEVGLLGEEAIEINAGFFSRVTKGRPLVTWKAATSLDGRIATHSGASRWITGAGARERGHLLRAQHDAIMIGSGTAIADDPRLTCRIPGLGERSPVRVVVDSRLQVPLTSALVRTANEVPTWIVTLAHNDRARRDALVDLGVELIEVEAGEDGRPRLDRALETIGDRGVTRLLVEGGGHLSASLLKAALIDRIVWFRAPSVIGGDGLPAAQPFGVDHPDGAPRFRRVEVVPVGDDVMEIYGPCDEGGEG